MQGSESKEPRTPWIQIQRKIWQPIFANYTSGTCGIFACLHRKNPPDDLYPCGFCSRDRWVCFFWSVQWWQLFISQSWCRRRIFSWHFIWLASSFSMGEFGICIRLQVRPPSSKHHSTHMPTKCWARYRHKTLPYTCTARWRHVLLSHSERWHHR